VFSASEFNTPKTPFLKIPILSARHATRAALSSSKTSQILVFFCKALNTRTPFFSENLTNPRVLRKALNTRSVFTPQLTSLGSHFQCLISPAQPKLTSQKQCREQNLQERGHATILRVTDF
jgi:hypothetical protein